MTRFCIFYHFFVVILDFLSTLRHDFKPYNLTQSMKKLATTLIAGLAACAGLHAQTALTASFSAREAAKEIYRQGFDTREGMTDWSVSATNRDYTWDWGTVKNQNIEDFSTIDPTSQYSAAIYYCDDCYQDETLCSPYFLLAKPSLIRLWTAFSGVWAYNGRFTIHAQRKSADTPDLLFDAFMWSQENRHEFHQWLEFEFDLEPYTSATDSVRILFRYESAGGGDDVYIDNFRLFEKAGEATATVAIGCGRSRGRRPPPPLSDTPWCATSRVARST